MATSALIGALRVTLGLDSAAFEKGAKKAEGSASAFGKRMSAIGGQMQKTGAIMSAAVTAPLVAFGASSLAAFQESEKAAAAVDAALKSMGQTAGFSAEQLGQMAANLQKTSTFDDDEILSKVTANLLTFGNVQGEVFARAQQAALNLSARLGQDLQSSAIQLGKALNDPIKGITALSRVGVAFTEEQKALIKEMVAVGDTAGAQAMILAELEKQYGGQAEALASTSAGRAQQLANAWGDFQEKIGEVIVVVLPPLIDLLSRLVDWLNTLDPQTVAWGVSIAAIAAALGPVLLGIGSLISILGTLGPAISGIAAVIGVMTNVVVALGPHLLTLGRIILSLLVATGPIGWLALAVAGIVAVWQNWDTIGPIVKRLYQAVKTWIMDKLGAVFDWVGEKVKAVTGFFKDMYIAVVGNSYVPDMVDGIAAEFARLQSVMVDPAQAAASDVAEAFADEFAQVSQTLSEASDEWGAGFEDLGHRIGQGLGDILADGKIKLREVVDLAGDIANQLFIQPFLSSLGGGGGQGGGGFLGGLVDGLFSVFAGGFAKGGIIPSGQWGVVGENGPELAFGGRSGMNVLPSGSAGGVTQIFNISTPDANSFRASERQIARASRQRMGMA